MDPILREPRMNEVENWGNQHLVRGRRGRSKTRSGWLGGYHAHLLQVTDMWHLNTEDIGKEQRHFRMVGEGTCLSPTPHALHSLHPLLPAKIILNTVNPSASPNQSPAHCCLTAQPFHWHSAQPCHCQPPKERNRRNRVFILQTTTLPGWLCSKVSLPVLLSPSVCFS